ncbi:rhomboid family intramembrane serine protease [Desulfonema magnum]|uniref:Rhomboid domain-containing protein n=1 Tax=Desulfonema magnum TaxID=45655 RepID=A0A975GR82_9BACT|nr:rhomboid family intramembrane serine protease [Desulfonema magnum]QTA90761.1 Rhomboid domain-containing protein [Desulfonema magnum]
MRYNRTRLSYGFGSGLTVLGRKLLIIYGVIYVSELLLEHWLNIPVVRHVMLWPFGDSNFHIWQVLTHPFIHDPRSPISFLIDCIVLYFFIGPVENAFGTRRFLILFYTAALGGALCGLVFSSVSGLNAPFSGMMPSLLSLIVIFGLLNPEATILLMFVLPIKAKYLSYGTIIITLLTFLAKANPYGAYHLGGILFGYVFFKGPRTLFDPEFIRFKYLEWQFKRKRSRFQVIDGDKNKKNKDKPTYH